MNKKLLLRYVFMCIPFVTGGLLYSFGIYNIISSLLLFGGGYIAVKNIFDYRKIKKNKKIVEETPTYKKEYKPRSSEEIIGFKRVRRHERVRRRVKW